MTAAQGMYIDIRSNGDDVIGRVYNVDEEKMEEVFRGSSRKEMLKKFRSKFNPSPSIKINRRGKTYF
jgi:hypothetical protein